MNDVNLRERVAAELPGALSDLGKLVAIPSISFVDEHTDDVSAAASLVSDLIRGLGWDDVKVVNEGGKPAVIAHFPAPEGKPTVCLYSHFDVQPTGDAARWSSEPFVTSEKGGRLYGRGVADDKGGVIAHLLALRALGGKPPVGVTLFFEGEEESGSPSMANILSRHHDELAADAFVLLDSGNWSAGQPAFTSSLRGLCDVVVTVSTLDHPVHSGQYGGLVPDALTSLCRLLNSLWDADGSVAIEGLDTIDVAELDYPEDRLRGECAALPGVSFIGNGSLVSRMWGQPAVSVIGIDAPTTEQASNTLIASASAKVSLRIAPGQDAHKALELLKAHLLTNAPFGAEVTFGEEGAAPGALLSVDGPIATAMSTAITDAFAAAPVCAGMGGSIPLANELHEAYPKAEVILTAVVDPDSRMHGYDESLDLHDFESAALAEAMLLAKLGE